MSVQPDEHTESELLRRIANGDEAAFTAFYNRYWKQVYTFLVRMTKSHEIAEELMCDIFTKLWTGRELIQEIRNMDAFLSKVAYNKALNFFRLTARQRKLQAIIAGQMEMQQNIEASHHRLLDHEAREILQKAIQQLSPQRRLVFTMSREQGLTHEEIARQLNLSVSTVKSTMAAALKSVRSFLQNNGMQGVVVLYYYVGGLPH